ncbi:MAG: glutathione S-transferase family protein [Pseudomonadales bacterium]|nr:glutathione S-transferase family protein [Pseudomonadales bacterium]NRA17666.1 glutathione S-transferase family protein [Oceanospirillaceae bacterium]
MPTAKLSQITLISHYLCPYVQRAIIALTEQRIEFKRIDIDLANKPAWFKKLSPLGKVPALLIDEKTVLFESNVIVEYINDISGSSLLATDPLARARERAWIEFASATLNNIGQLYNAKTEVEYLHAYSLLESKWCALEKNLSGSTFFNGEHFSLVDAAFAPVFRYFDAFENFSEFKFLSLCTQTASWRKNLALRPSVKTAVAADYIGLLTAFVIKRNSYLGSLANNYQLKLR